MPIFKLLRSFVTLSLFNTTLQSEFPEIHLILVQKQSFAQIISRYLPRYHIYGISVLTFKVSLYEGRPEKIVNKLIIRGQY